jgi:hypothetical protein
MAASLSPGEYFVGAATTVAIVGSLGWGAHRLCSGLLPGWRGIPSRLAELVVFLAALLAAALAVGSFGWLTRGWVTLACVLVGLGIGLVGTRLRLAPLSVEPSPPVRREHAIVAVAGVALVSAQWVSHTVATWGTGMTEGDTLWYHGSFAARLVQLGRVDVLPGVGPEAQRFFPINTQLLHAVAFLPFGRDLLSPVVNLLFFLIALLAAWCIGRRRGLGPLCVLGAELVLGLPTIAGTQPGQATNDVACAALLLAGVALVLEGRTYAAPAALAAVAGGLGVGTKLTVGLAVGLLVLGVVVFALRDRRPWTAVIACVALLLSSAYWFARNWALLGTPLPWAHISIGPIQLHQTAQLPKHSAIANYLTDGHVINHVWIPGLFDTLGPLWPVVGVGIVAGLVVTIAPRRTRFERLAGLVACAAAFEFLVTPYVMEFGGGLFVATVRYGAPIFLLGMTLMPLGVCADRWSSVWLRVLWIAMAAIMIVNALRPMRARLAPWATQDLGLALLVGFVVLGIGTAVVLHTGTPRWSGRALAIVAIGALVVVAGLGWFVQRHYLSRRYVTAGIDLDAVDAHLQRGGFRRVLVVGTIQYYPLFGADFSNQLIVPKEPRHGAPLERCEAWRRTLNKAHAQYLVYGPRGGLDVTPREWALSDPALHRVVVEPNGGALYRIDGPLDPAGCKDVVGAT